MKKIFLLLVVLSVFVGSSVYGRFTKVGTAGAQFLKIGIGSRAIGMGEAFVAVANDASALYWNPAGIARLKGSEVIFSYINWVADINENYLGYVRPMGNFGTVGAQLTLLTMGSMQLTQVDDPTTAQREDEGEGLPRFSASDFALGLTYAKNFTDKFSFGLTTKFVRQAIWEMSANGIGFDLGSHYNTGWRSVRLGMEVANFGPDLKYGGRNLDQSIRFTDWPITYQDQPYTIKSTPFAMPLRFRFGIAYDVLDKNLHRLTTALDLVHPNDGSEKLNGGAEYSWKNMVFLRAGYKYDPDARVGDARKSGMDNVNFGGGLNYTMKGLTAKIDYSYTNLGFLENAHRITLGLQF